DPDCLTVVSGANTLTASAHQPVTHADVETIDVASAIRFGAPAGDYGEGAGTAAIPVTRSGTGNASAQYATTPLTALAGSDFSSSAGTLSLGPGATSGTINVPLVDDATIEGNETFGLDLTGPSAFAHVCEPTQFV